ncbi:hypothetical protein Mycch_2698 [Mycolicibacterium chubuense NBB4]|uniref:DUF7159 domain-containing protein n=1 Tax=Mycolicibacterium chubuense (strain NBB4) TaxID=710421 RepID=I4BJK4_MYCCN|nr:hypothetical protein [Mycolicibacterium chubuense]AFM17461.1 hypothetical protein Mycch_2698 [Mycolicibacterium chubuense NBB4]
MRVVLGLSLTATSAVWTLVDTSDGTIIADEVVALDAPNEIARAAARSVQSFALQSERDIDGVRMTWSDDAAAHAIRLRTKLRLFGFDTIETVSTDAAREARNQTARHIAPHLVLAYGAARADLHDDHRTMLQRLTARAPLAIAGAAGVVTVAAVGLYAVLSGAPSETPTPAVAAHPAAPAPPPAAPAPDSAPMAVPVAPAPQVVAAPEPAPSVTSAPAVTAQQPEAEDVTTTTEAVPAAVAVPEQTTTAVPTMVTAAETTPAATEPDVTMMTGQPHLTGGQLAAGPVQAVVAPAPASPALAPASQAFTPASPVVAPAPPAPAAPTQSNGPLSAFLGALP